MISAHLALQHAYRIALTQAIKQALRLRVFSELSSPSFIIDKPIRLVQLFGDGSPHSNCRRSSLLISSWYCDGIEKKVE